MAAGPGTNGDATRLPTSKSACTPLLALKTDSVSDAAVRSRPEPLGRVPAIVVSAFANTDDQSRALSAGYQLHVAKPVEPPELIAAVAALLRSKARRADETDSERSAKVRPASGQ
jgi:DNA-binding response OmpR family regulator